jgi:ribose 5-phosphate isomerase B
MKIACGFDHAGFLLKGAVFEVLLAEGHEVLDLGTHSTEPVDYPDVAVRVGEAVREGRAERGVLVCGSGAGVAVAATKMIGIRAATVHETYTAHQSVEHDDVNVLCLGARVVGPALAADILRIYVGASFTGEERHRRRLEKVNAIERKESQCA